MRKRGVTLFRDEEGTAYDFVAGNFLIVGLVDDCFCSLSEELLEKYRNLYPAVLLYRDGNGELMEIPVGSGAHRAVIQS